ncbi:MAG: cation diffusion facilitator family transporter [Bacteroidales bacterium]|nr:cation diffusion facilitator family transporter [Bacteroidales bacterium]
MACHLHHHHHSTHNHTTTAEHNISTAFWLNATFVIIEIVGGLWTNSIAILSDALHDFGDCLSLLVAWLLQKKAAQPANTTYSYGYKRFSLLGAIFLAGVLTVSSVWMITESVQRLFAPQDVHATGMLWIAIVGIIINGIAALRVKNGTSINERMVYLHILEDALGWVAVLVASIVMHFVHLPILDPLLSLSISLWVLFNVLRGLKTTFSVLLQAVPKGLSTDVLTKELLAIEGVESIHDLHVWSLDGENHVMTLHAVTHTHTFCEVRTAIHHVAEGHGIKHCTIEVEQPNTPCPYANGC